MSTLPVTRSVLSDAALCDLLRERYRLSARATCRLLKTFVNDSYLITDQEERYIFRIYSLNWRSKEEIAEELRLIHLLKENDISVSYPIADAEGDAIEVLAAPEGERLGVLFSFAEGEKKYDLSAEIHYKVGEMMANMHRLTANFRLNRIDYTPKVMLEDSFEKFQSYLPDGSEERAFMLMAQQYLLKTLTEEVTGKLRQGAVHLDFWADNLHVNADNRITLFDFDFCGNAPLCYDIAFHMLMLHASTPDEAVYREKSDAFLKGYESVIPLAEEEKRLIPAIGVALYFFYLGVQRERFATIFFNEEHLKRYVQFRVKKWWNFQNLPMQG